MEENKKGIEVGEELEEEDGEIANDNFLEICELRGKKFRTSLQNKSSIMNWSQKFIRWSCKLLGREFDSYLQDIDHPQITENDFILILDRIGFSDVSLYPFITEFWILDIFDFFDYEKSGLIFLDNIYFVSLLILSKRHDLLLELFRKTFRYFMEIFQKRSLSSFDLKENMKIDMKSVRHYCHLFFLDDFAATFHLNQLGFLNKKYLVVHEFARLMNCIFLEEKSSSSPTLSKNKNSKNICFCCPGLVQYFVNSQRSNKVHPIETKMKGTNVSSGRIPMFDFSKDEDYSIRIMEMMNKETKSTGCVIL